MTHHLVVILNDNRMTPQGHFGHFNMGTLEIKFFYRSVGREYGGGGRICHKHV